MLLFVAASQRLSALRDCGASRAAGQVRSCRCAFNLSDREAHWQRGRAVDMRRPVRHVTVGSQFITGCFSSDLALPHLRVHSAPLLFAARSASPAFRFPSTFFPLPFSTFIIIAMASGGDGHGADGSRAPLPAAAPESLGHRDTTGDRFLTVAHSALPDGLGNPISHGPVLGRGPRPVPGFAGEAAMAPAWSCPPPRVAPSWEQPRDDSLHRFGGHRPAGGAPGVVPAGNDVQEPSGPVGGANLGALPRPPPRRRAAVTAPEAEVAAQRRTTSTPPSTSGTSYATARTSSEPATTRGRGRGARRGSSAPPAVRGRGRGRGARGGFAAVYGMSTTPSCSAPPSPALDTVAGGPGRGERVRPVAARMYAPPPSDTPTPTFSTSLPASSQAVLSSAAPSSTTLPPSGRRARGSRSPSPKRRANEASAATSVAAAGAAAIASAGQTSTADGTDLKALVRAITSGFKALEGKVGKLHDAVDHLSNLVTSNTGKVDGLAVRMQASVTAQSSTVSTLEQFRDQLTTALAAAAAATPEGRASNTEESPGDGDGRTDDDSEARGIALAVRVRPFNIVCRGGLTCSECLSVRGDNARIIFGID